MDKYNDYWYRWNTKSRNLKKNKNGGWHLSCFCDKYLIKNKLENFSHIEYNIPKYTNLETIQVKNW